MNKVWSESEKEFIKNNAGIMTDNVLSIKLSQITGRNVTLQAVRKQRQKLGIAKIPGRGKCGIVQVQEVNSGHSKEDCVF